MLPQGVKQGRPNVQSESISVAVDRKSDRNRAVAVGAPRPAGVGLVEAAPTNGRAAVETEAPRKRRRLTDCGSSLRLIGMDASTPEKVLEPEQGTPRAHIAQGRSSKSRLIERRSKSSGTSRSRAREWSSLNLPRRSRRSRGGILRTTYGHGGVLCRRTN